MKSCISLLTIFVLVVNVKGLGLDEFSRNDFPPAFIFGSATSAYQVEGAAKEDGRTPSIWDTYAYAAYTHGASGDVAADEYHKYMEDVRLMAETGLDAYGFSISWSRLISNGRGSVNPKGLRYYNNLINELISHGIQPHVTLHHQDFPQVLEDEYGGWINRKIIEDFTAYADVCFREFGDRVQYWTTLNEPNVFALGGYDEATGPPGRCSPPFGQANCSRGNSTVEPYLAVHNMLLAHASVARLYEQKYKDKQHGFIGMSVYAFGFVPLTNSKEDEIATQRAKDFFVGWIIDPLVFGDYPDSMRKTVGSRLPAFTDHEAEQLKDSFDFIGLIHYTTVHIRDNSATLTLKERDVFADMGFKFLFIGNTSLTEFPIAPWGLEGLLDYLKRAYGNPPIFILENGQGTKHNSSLKDTIRVEYLHAYIGALLNAIRKGSDIRGYFQWSFLDLFELLSGYDISYGLYYVDFEDPDLRRYPKLSANWYSHFLKGNSVSSNVILQLQKNLTALCIVHSFE